MSYETERWEFVPARHFKAMKERRAVRVIVIHVMESPEGPLTAERVAQYFATTERPASAHVCVDGDSIIQCVKDNDVAYAAPGCNHDGLQIEVSGYANQGVKGWLDRHSIAALALAADVVAQYSLKYRLPILHLGDKALAGGSEGIVGHDQVSRVYKKSTHTDPGPSFPWERFLSMAMAFATERRRVQGVI